MTSLVKAIDKFVADHKDDRMAAFVVLLDENTEANQKKLEAIAEEQRVTIPLTIAMAGKKGPGGYELNPEVPITVLVANRNVVRANVALAGPAPSDEKAQAKEVEDVLAAAQAVLEKK